MKYSYLKLYVDYFYLLWSEIKFDSTDITLLTHVKFYANLDKIKN